MTGWDDGWLRGRRVFDGESDIKASEDNSLGNLWTVGDFDQRVHYFTSFNVPFYSPFYIFSSLKTNQTWLQISCRADTSLPRWSDSSKWASMPPFIWSCQSFPLNNIDWLFTDFALGLLSGLDVLTLAHTPHVTNSALTAPALAL